MKKLFTLILALAGMVGTASATTIYVQNTRAWASIYLYEWNVVDGKDEPAVAWPGTQQCVSEIVDGNWYFKITISKDNFILNNNAGIQTENLTTTYYDNNAYYWIWEDNKGITKMDAPTYTTSYSFTVQGESISNIYTYQDENKLTGEWPGAYVIASDGKYNLTYKSSSISGKINVIFNNGSGNSQTCNLEAEAGNNEYYIGSLISSQIDGSWGEAVKTNAYGYATYVNTKNITVPSGTAYYATDGYNGSATATSIANPAANTPMLIRGNPSTTYFFAVASTGDDKSSENAFKKGTGSTLDSEADGKFNYILNGDAFYLANGQTVGTTKAYLQLSHKAQSRVLKFADNEETGIAFANVSAANNDSYFNLSGQHIANPVKGLYIKGGKKVIVK